MSEVKQAIARVYWDFLPNIHSDLPVYLATDRGICCRLHSASDPSVMPVRGCGAAKLGTHQAIEEFHHRGVSVCHAYAGQLVIDKEFAMRILYPHPDFFDKCYARTNGFLKRYAGGTPVGVATYGSGYCYLRLMITKMRSRIARILGPNPLVVDVLRAYLASGFVYGNTMIIREVAPGQFHVANQRYKDSFMNIANKLITIITQNENARIGLDVVEEEPIGEYVVTSVDEGIERGGLVAIPCASGGVIMGVGADAYDGLCIEDSDRRAELMRWFSTNGVDVSANDLDQLMMCTVASAHLKGAWANEIKKIIKVWALYGDVVLKKYAVLHVIGSMGNPADYAKLGAEHTNKSLAVKLLKCGLRSACCVPMLAVDSDVNGTIFEAVLGYVALVFPGYVVRRLLSNIGMFGDGRYVVSDVAVIKEDMGVNLNSHQLAIVKQMIIDGKL